MNAKVEEDNVGSDAAVVRRGAMAGLLAGSVLIVVFFVMDLLAGQPLATPTFLSGVLFGDMAMEADPLRIGIYTAAHFIVFILLGIVAALFFTALGVPRNLMIGAAYGLFACSAVFYPALIMTGTDILAAPAWPAVFFGNVIAGVVIVGYLHWVSEERGVTGLRSLLKTNSILRQGIIAGLIGAAVVAVWFLVVDSVAGRALFTPAALGSALLNGTGPPPGVEFSSVTILGYSLFHLAGFLLAGVVGSLLMTQAEKSPHLVFGIILLFVIVETFFIFMVAMLGSWLMEELAWWSVLVGNVLAALSMGGYLLKVHPVLRAGLTDDALWADH